jgi:acylphosphatase
VNRRVRAIVSGRVQGVSYRASTVDAARRLDIVGWVRNRADGSVELEAEGPPDQISVFLEWCKDGPPHAHVTAVAVEELEPTGAEKHFSISR